MRDSAPPRSAGPRRRQGRKLVAAVSATALAALGIAGTTSLLATSAQAATATGQITGYQGLCLDVRGAGSADGTPVQVYTCNGTNAQQWAVDNTANTVQALGKCLDVSGAGTANGTLVQLYTCNGTGAQYLVKSTIRV